MVKRSTLQRALRSPGFDVALCLLVCLPVLFIFFAVSLYNHPMLDDFWYIFMTGKYGYWSFIARKYGYWNAQARVYAIFTPRYLALAISCFTPLAFGNFSGYWAVVKLFPSSS
jgi:hypothetical protein